MLTQTSQPSVFNQSLPYDEGFARQLLADPSRESLLVWADWLEEHAPEFAQAVREIAETSYRPFYSRVIDHVYWGVRSQTSRRALPKIFMDELINECRFDERSHLSGSIVFGVEVTRQGPLRFQAEAPRAYMAALLAAAVIYQRHRLP
jgi:hypothetical protein